MDGFRLGHNQRVGAERLPVQNENYYFDAKMDDLISHKSSNDDRNDFYSA